MPAFQVAGIIDGYPSYKRERLPQDHRSSEDNGSPRILWERHQRHSVVWVHLEQVAFCLRKKLCDKKSLLYKNLYRQLCFALRQEAMQREYSVSAQQLILFLPSTINEYSMVKKRERFSARIT
jgi:hypothetical protein